MEDAAVAALRALEEELRDDPNSFGFFQAVSLLERLSPEREGVGRFVDPASEAVRFSVNRTIAFPASEIQALTMDGGGPARMLVNFMGLIGPSGVLPHHYTLLAGDQGRKRGSALGDFLDLFHHRILSLFYRAWRKNRFAVGMEGGEDPLREHVLDLVGMGVEELRADLPFEEEVLAFYSGLLSSQHRGAVALEQLLEDYFEVPVEVHQFEGAWFGLPERDLCELGEEDGPSSRLGAGAVVGDEIWDPQSRVRIRVGPLTLEQYRRFLPNGEWYSALREIARFFANDEHEFDLQLVLSQPDVPGCILGADDQHLQPLGWSTWIGPDGFSRDADETILRL